MTESLENGFRSILGRFCQRQQEDQKTVHEYSADQRPNEHSVQFVDLENYGEARERMSGLLSPGLHARFNNDERFVRNLRWYAIIAQVDNGPTVAGLRAMVPAQKPDRGKWFVGAIKNQALQRYEQLTDDLLLFDDQIDCLLCENLVFITNKDKFERIFNFYEMHRAAASRALTTIGQELHIHNFEEFRDLCLRDPRKQARLARIAGGVDLSLFTVANARLVMAANRGLEGIISEVGGREVLTYDRANHWALLRFLDESTVRSIVTGTDFEADNKRAL